MRATPEPTLPRCPNCGSERGGAYCSACGQAQRIRKRTLWMIVADFLAHSFAYDNRFWRTLVPLLAHPGLVTAENLRERWVAYLPPLRIYLVASLLFFFVFSWNVEIGPDGGSNWSTSGSDTFRPADARILPDDWTLTSWINDAIQSRAEHLASLPPAEAERALQREALRSIPTLLLLALPLFALGLKLLWIFQGRWYFEHFVFATHFYSVWLIVATLSLLVGQPWLWWLSHGVYLPLWLFLGLRRAYRQHWFWTLAKMFALFAWQIASAFLLLFTVFAYAFFRV